MSAIVELARRLGQAIADSPQAKALKAAREEMNRQGEIAETLKLYHQQADKVARLEQEKKPVEVEDKHKLHDLQSKLVSFEAFKKFTGAQVDYIDMMRQVNETLKKHMGEIE